MSDSYMELPPSKGLRFLPYYAFGNVSDFMGNNKKEDDILSGTKDSSISTGIVTTLL